MKNNILYDTNQNYMFCLNSIMALLPFANPEKFYSKQVMDLHKEMFQIMKDSGIISIDEKFHPYVLTEELFVETINNLLEKIPANSKKTYKEKLNTLLNSTSNINEVIYYFEEERIRLDKLLSEFYF